MSDSDDASPPQFVRLEDENSEEEVDWEDPSDGGVLTKVLGACESGSGDAQSLVSLLRSLTVSIDSKGAEGDTALHNACLYGHTHLVQVLLQSGASVQIKDNDGGTPMHDACAGGYFEIVCLLITSLRASSEGEVLSAVNAQDGDGETPLHVATRGGNVEVVKILLQNGANKETKSEAGLVPRDYSVEGSELDHLMKIEQAPGTPK